MYMFNLIILILFCIIKLTKLQSVPSVPCPKLFQYTLNSENGETEGRLTLRITKTGKNDLLVKLIYPPGVINNNFGKITLAKSNEEIKNDILQNRPIHWRIRFPTTDPVPALKEIISNNKIICSNPDSLDFGSEIILTHELNIPSTLNLAVNSEPEFIETVTQNIRPNRIQRPSSSRNSHSNNNANIDSTECGKTTIPINLIFGGEKIKPGSWPWLVAMFANSKGKFVYICSGSLVSQQAIISAAHCIVQSGKAFTVGDIRIGLGMHNIENWNEFNAQISGVNNIIVHPEYGRKKMYDADIAILILDRRYSYTNFIRPVCIWKNEFDDASNSDGQVAGWGEAKVGGGREIEPSIVDARIVSDRMCLDSNDAFISITSQRNLCAGFQDETGPCRGDSGSGLIIDVKGTWYLRATVSGSLARGKTCDLKQYVIYTDVAQFTNWIRQYI